MDGGWICGSNSSKWNYFWKAVMEKIGAITSAQILDIVGLDVLLNIKAASQLLQVGHFLKKEFMLRKMDWLFTLENVSL